MVICSTSVIENGSVAGPAPVIVDELLLGLEPPTFTGPMVPTWVPVPNSELVLSIYAL